MNGLKNGCEWSFDSFPNRKSSLSSDKIAEDWIQGEGKFTQKLVEVLYEIKQFKLVIEH